MSESNTSVSFYEILDLIDKRPGMYLPRRSIFDFQAFYFGYELCRHSRNLPRTEEEEEFGEFLVWLREVCPVKTNHPWANLLFFYANDEREAFDRFFELFREFRKQKESENSVSDEAIDPI